MNSTDKPYARRLENTTIPIAIEAAAADLQLPFCDVSGFGTLNSVEIAKNNSGDDTISIPGPLNLLQLTGRIRRIGDIVISEFMVILSKIDHGEIQMLGGRLMGGTASTLEVSFTPLFSVDDATQDKKSFSVALPQAPPEQPDLEEKERETIPVIETDQWAKALEESRKQERQARAARLEVKEAPVPSLGDIVNHRQFGECKVVKLTDDHIALRKPNGRIVQLGLTILHFAEVGSQNGTPLWDVQIGR